MEMERCTSVYSIKEDEDDKSSNRQNLESKNNLTSITNENFTKTGTTLYRYSYSNYLSLLINIVGISLISLSLDDNRNILHVILSFSNASMIIYTNYTQDTQIIRINCQIGKTVRDICETTIERIDDRQPARTLSDASIRSYPRHEGMPPIIRWNDIAFSPPNLHHTRSHFPGEESRDHPLTCQLQ